MGKLERHQYALSIMRRRIQMLMAGEQDYLRKLEHLMKAKKNSKVSYS